MSVFVSTCNLLSKCLLFKSIFSLYLPKLLAYQAETLPEHTFGLVDYTIMQMNFIFIYLFIYINLFII